MSSALLILLIISQLVVAAVFFCLIWPMINSERWKEKFWHDADAQSLVLAFALIALVIVLLPLILDKLLPVEVLP